MNKIRKIYLVYLLTALVWFIWYTFKFQFTYTNLYYITIIFALGIPLYSFKKTITQTINKIPLTNFVKYILLGYGMVLLEEIFAALFNHLNEGFNLSLYMVRVLQFWVFNVFAFIGLFFGIYLFSKFIKFSKTELFFIAGFWGLFAEKTYTLIDSNFVGFIVWAPIIIAVYGIIMTPAIWSIKHEGKKELPILKYIAIYTGIFILSIIPILILSYMRLNFPALFPPTKFIP